MPVSEEIESGSSLYTQKYRTLKRKLKFLIYENECFQDELRKSQRKLLKVERDKAFLLDRLLHYEQINDTSSDSDVTISSDSENEVNNTAQTTAPNRKKKLSGSGEPSTTVGSSVVSPAPGINVKPELAVKKKKPAIPKKTGNKQVTSAVQNVYGHMTSEEIERHLESKQLNLDLMPERAPSTVPTELFSNDPSSMDSEQNDATAGESSPSNVGEVDESLIIDLPE